MSTKKKLLQAAAGSAGGAGLDVDEVFQTTLWTGNASTQTITTGIDLSGEGGLLWFKQRTSGTNEHHWLLDSERTAQYTLSSNLTSAQINQTGYAPTFTSTGFSLYNWASANDNNEDYVGWSFRQAPKFFDCVKITGDGTSGRNISHALGQKPGMIIGKRYDGAGEHWHVYHRAIDSTNPSHYAVQINRTNARQNESSYWNDTEPTSTQFTVGSNLNHNGGSFIFYLFAHNDGDGEFGDGDQDIIKCGSYTNGASGVEVNLGFEPQWMMFKKTDGTGNWSIVDVMRGIKVVTTVGDNSNQLRANLTNAENAEYNPYPTPTGFKTDGSGGGGGGSSGDYIYMAIRRGPLAEPENATDVFNVLKETSANLNQSPPYLQQTGFPVDVVSNKTFDASSSWWTATRLTDARLQLESTAAETSVSSTHEFDHNDGVAVNGLTGSTNFVGYHWRRAPSYFDVVAYNGTGSAQTISHNLLAVPEMMWVKKRSGSNNWKTFHSSLGATKSMELNTTVAAETNGSALWNSTAPTASVFTVGSAGDVNSGSHTYVAYLFATVAGVSKVGSYTGDGTAGKVIDCGFSARFVLIKKSSDTGGWFVYDTERGIVSGNDPYLFLNSSNAQNDQTDSIDPNSSGFAVNYSNTNANGQTYIFYAIA